MYLIDGYNLLFRLIKFSDSQDLKTQRNELIDSLSKKIHLAKLSAILVFDSYHQIGPSETLVKNNLSIHFSEYGQTADQYILEMVSKDIKPHLLTVVTSDLLLASSAKREGAKSLTIPQFLETLNGICRKKLIPKVTSKAMPKVELIKKITPKVSLKDHYEKIFEDKIHDQSQSQSIKSRQKKIKLQKKDNETEEKTREKDFDRYLRVFSKKTGA